MKTFLPLEHHQKLTAELCPSLRWDGERPLAGLQAEADAKLRELLGMDAFVPCDPRFSITDDDIVNGNRRIHFTIQTEEGYHTHCDLMLPPVMPEGKLPLCVCLQGHSRGAHTSLGVLKYPGDEVTIGPEDAAFCLQAVENGFAALAVEQRSFGQCGGTENGPQCIRPVLTALLLGRTMIGERVWDVMKAVDAVEANFADIVTMDGSVLVGLSGGGTATYYTACLEHRFSAYMPAGAVCTYLDSIVNIHHCSCNYVPGIAKYFDMGDMAVMIAPKKLVVVTGDEDPIFPIAGVEKSYAIIRKLYAGIGAEENCTLVVGHGGHRFYAAEAWPAMKAMLAK